MAVTGTRWVCVCLGAGGSGKGFRGGRKQAHAVDEPEQREHRTPGSITHNKQYENAQLGVRIIGIGGTNHRNQLGVWIIGINSGYGSTQKGVRVMGLRGAERARLGPCTSTSGPSANDDDDSAYEHAQEDRASK